MKVIKEFLICLTVGIIIGATFVAVNYYSNIEKDAHYAEVHGVWEE